MLTLLFHNVQVGETVLLTVDCLSIIWIIMNVFLDSVSVARMVGSLTEFAAACTDDERKGCYIYNLHAPLQTL